MLLWIRPWGNIERSELMKGSLVSLFIVSRSIINITGKNNRKMCRRAFSQGHTDPFTSWTKAALSESVFMADPNEPLKHEKHTQLSHLASCVHAHSTSRMTRTCYTSGVHSRGILGWAETLLPNRKKHLLNRLCITVDWSWLKATLVDSQKCFMHHSDDFYK